MKYLTIKPLLGTKNDCPIDSPSLYKPVDQRGTIFLTHDTGGQNFDLNREKDSCSKAFGRSQWSNSATAQKTKCLGLMELWDGTNRNHLYWDNGKFYVYDGSRDPAAIEDAGTTTFATDDVDLYSIINFGGYAIFADRAEHTPYKWKHGDANTTKLILSGTEYKFRYLMHLANRIVGVYSDQTNGDLDIRYTDALPTWATLDFPAANQFYKPEGDAGLTACGKLGHNTGFLYSEEDITRMDYYSSSTPVFTAVRIMRGWGSVNHACLVSDGINHYTFDKNRGFYKFNGVSEPIIISDDYEGMISRIPASYLNLITGKQIPFTNEIAWNIPVDSDSTPSKIIFYNTKTGQWRHENKAARVLDVWRTFTTLTWNDLVVLTDDVWPTQHTWAWYLNEASNLVFGNSDGQLYASTSEGDNAANWDGYRIEPILPFPDASHYNRLLEIWLSVAEKVNASIDIYWRGGDTVGELEQEPWTSLGSISMNSPADPVLYVDQSARLHQIKWGTNLKSEPFSANELKFGYVTQGRY